MRLYGAIQQTKWKHDTVNNKSSEQQIDSKIHHNTANNKSEHCKYNHTHVRVTYSTQPFLLCKKKCCTHTNGPPLLFFFTHHSHKTHSHIYTHTISYCDTIIQYPFNESRREVSPCILYTGTVVPNNTHCFLVQLYKGTTYC